MINTQALAAIMQHLELIRRSNQGFQLSTGYEELIDEDIQSLGKYEAQLAIDILKRQLELMRENLDKLNKLEKYFELSMRFCFILLAANANQFLTESLISYLVKGFGLYQLLTLSPAMGLANQKAIEILDELDSLDQEIDELAKINYCPFG